MERATIKKSNAPDPILSGELGARASRTIGLILQTLLVILPILLVSAWAALTPAEATAIAVLLATVGVLLLLHRKKLHSATVYGLVFSLIAYGAIAVAAYGSIRGLGSLAFVGAIVVGGIFLGRTALVAAVVSSSALLGVLIHAEMQGWMRQPDFAVGAVHWLIHTAVIATIALNVYYARNLVVEALVRARESGAHLAKIFRSNPAALLRTTLDDARILDINESYERMFGMARDKALGASMASFNLWHDPATRDEFYARVRRADRVVNMPAVFRRNDTETFEALISAEIFEVGAERQLLSTVTDISELVRTQSALRASVERFEKIFRSSPAALTVVDLETRELISANEAAVRIFGQPAEEVVGKSVGTRYWADPQDSARLRARVLAEGRVARTPVRLLRGNGEPFDALISLEVFEDQGRRYLISLMEDISEERAARRALQASEERFTQIFRSNPAALVTVALEDSRITDINETFERMFGIGPSEAVGSIAGSFGLWNDPRDREPFLAQLHRAGRLQNVPAVMKRRNGEPFDALLSAEILRFGDSRQILTTVTDISELSRARAALRISEERFSSAFRFSPIGMTITRLSDGTLLEVNDADKLTLGYERGEVIGRRSTETGAWLSVEDRNRFIARLESEGAVSGYETRMRNKAGENVDCQIWASKVDLNGEPCVLSAIMNVTEKKREEALILSIARGVSGETGTPFFRTLVVHLANALRADIAIVGEIVSGNRVRTLAILRDGEIAPDIDYSLEGTPCETTGERTGLTLYSDRVAELFPQDEALAKGGMRGYVGIALRDPEGTPIGVLNVICRTSVDQTARTEALFMIFAARAQAELLRMRRDREIAALNASLEQRVAERTAQLEAANRELEAFSYSVSHDLRAPLRAIDGFVRVLAGEQGKVDDATRARAQSRVLSATARMNELIEDLIGLARVSAQAPNRESVDLGLLVHEVAATLRERDPGHPVELSVQAGLAARCDRALMRIALENLLGNAWKFTGGRAGARVEFGAEAQAGGETAFFVRDNGAGFEQEYAHRLFAPFQRLHSDREFEGTGIGLATVQRVIALHGGRAWAVGETGKGATVYFTCGAP